MARHLRAISVIGAGLVLGLAVATTNADSYLDAGIHYPSPPVSPVRLFYIQRSPNANTVVYDARLGADGRLDATHPIDAYWLRYNTTGERRELGFWERVLAYGVQTVRYGAGYRGWFNAYPEREFYLDVDKAGHPRVTLNIAGRLARLDKIYVAADDNGLWPTVHYIMLYGEDAADGTAISERVDP